MGKQEYMSSRSMFDFETRETESAASSERDMLGEVWKLGRCQNSLASLVPAPPRGYIHFEGGMLRVWAMVVEVRRMAPARFTVLNAFIRRG